MYKRSKIRSNELELGLDVKKNFDLKAFPCKIMHTKTFVTDCMIRNIVIPDAHDSKTTSHRVLMNEMATVVLILSDSGDESECVRIHATGSNKLSYLPASFGENWTLDKAWTA